MNVKLTPHSEELLRSYLARGGYRTAEEVIERALDTLAERDLFSVARTDLKVSASILELQGLGKIAWQGMDAQEYVDRERAARNG